MLQSRSQMQGLGGVLAPVDHVVGILARLALLLSAFIMLGMIGLITIEVVLRSLFSQSLLIVDEFVGYMLAAFAFLGLGYAARTQSLLRIDTFFTMMSPKTQIVAQILFDIASLVYVSILTGYVIQLVKLSYSRGIISVSIFPVPTWIPQSSMAIGGTILVLVLLMEVLRDIAMLRRTDGGTDNVD